MIRLSALLVATLLAPSAEGQEWFDFEWGDDPPATMTLATADSLVEAWSADYRSRGLLRYPAAAGVVDDSTDFDFDGRPDLALADLPTCGNAGCPRLIYLAGEGDRYDLAGQAFYHDLAFWTCPDAPGSGRLVYYHRVNAAEGGVNTLRVSRGAVELVDSRPWVWERDFADEGLTAEVIPDSCRAGGE